MIPRPSTKLIKQLEALGQHAVQGNLVEVLVTCGTAGCACHQDPNRRHGPHLYLRYRDLEGRSRSMYVRRSHERQMRQAVEAWGQMWQAMLQLSQTNREELRRQMRHRESERHR